MKSFYSSTVQAVSGLAVGAPSVSHSETDPVPRICSRARIAVYDASSTAPRVVDVEPGPVHGFIEALASKIHELSHLQGGDVPYTVIREVTENFIHASFREPVISVLEAGSTIRFADQGPGFPDKERVLLPGFTTACGEMKRFIRGVGSGLPKVRDYLVHSGGYLAIEDNLGGGAVVTVHAGPKTAGSAYGPRPTFSSPWAFGVNETPPTQGSLQIDETPSVVGRRLSVRQQQVLALVLESGLAGPSLVSRELGVGISTAYRDLATLEEAGLIASDSGKRTLTSKGLSFLGNLTTSNTTLK